MGMDSDCSEGSGPSEGSVSVTVEMVVRVVKVGDSSEASNGSEGMEGTK